MSSPIAIPFANSNSNSQGAQRPNEVARSLPGNANGLYVPVHRRGGSASSISSISSSSFLERGSLSPIARPTHDRMRSVSPMPRTPRSPRAFGKLHLDMSPAPSPRAADIPLASMIPNTYTISQLLALSSSAMLPSPSERARIDAHIPLMTRKPKSSSPPSATPSSSSVSASSSPVSEPAQLPTAPAPAPKANPDAQRTRRRRPGRKNSGGKPRVAPALGADVEERRRRTHGANWGWAAHAGNGIGRAPQQESWRSHAGVAVLA